MPSVAISCNALNDGKSAIELQKLLDGVRVDLDALRVSHNVLLASFALHFHGGVTAGAANTSPVAVTTAAVVVLSTTP